jgi:hypothetical protein
MSDTDAIATKMVLPNIEDDSSFSQGDQHSVHLLKSLSK